jgi:PAS domain S-box-containing protein
MNPAGLLNRLRVIFWRFEEFPNDIHAFYEAIHPQDKVLVHDLLQRHFADPTHVPYEIDMRILCKNAQYKWIRSRGKTILNADGAPYRMVGAHTDIDENKKQIEALEIMHRRYKAIMENAPDGIYVMDTQGYVVECNQQAAQMLGYTIQEMQTLHVHDWDGAFTKQELIEFIKKISTHPVNFETKHKRKDGTIYDAAILAVRIQIADKDYIYASVRDITQITKQAKIIKKQNEEFKTIFDISRDGLAILDLESNFLDCNDAYLLMTGFSRSELLQTSCIALSIPQDHERAQKAMQITRETGYLESFEKTCIVRDGKHIIVRMALSLMPDKERIGVTFYSKKDNVDADILIRQADQAMYEAKLRGKNQIAVFEDISEFLSLVSENALAIKNALKKSEFMLYYQPKVNMKSGDIIGVEALIRWNDPERGIVYPDDFLPIVDNRPLMYEIDRWVFNEALAQLCCWCAQGIETKMSINISAYTFKQAGFFSLVDDALAKYPEMKPFMIDIEILESSSLHEINEVRQIIEKLHERKITVSLDDFGTGYSTLSYLKVLGVDTLKIDKSFVLDILHDLGDFSIVDASVSLAQAFNAQPLAEGVESVAHGKLLVELGCQLAQGYIIARPMPAEMFPKWAAEWKSPQSWQDANKRD